MALGQTGGGGGAPGCEGGIWGGIKICVEVVDEAVGMLGAGEKRGGELDALEEQRAFVKARTRMKPSGGACFDPAGGGFGIEDTVVVRHAAVGGLGGESAIDPFIVA